MARAGDVTGVREVLRRFDRWEIAIGELQRGTGGAQGLSLETRLDIVAKLVEHRSAILDDLRERYGAELAPGASAEPGSDADLNVRGDRAGENLISARQELDRIDPQWQTRYRMALLIDANRVGTVQEVLASLPAAERARVQPQIDRRITRTGELFALSRRARVAEGDARTEILNSISDAGDRARVRQLAEMDQHARNTAHDQALRDGDALMANLRGITDPAERARIAADITEKQMLANMLNPDAYITPGAVGTFANSQPIANPAQRYQAAIDQIDMIAHQVHVGNPPGVLGAMRSYEIFKYIMRLCDVIEGSRLVRAGDEAQLTFFRNWAEYVYRVERAATANAEATQGRLLAGSADTARVRLSDTVDLNGELSGVSNEFLIDNYDDFQAFADRYSGILREAGLAEPATAGTPVPRPAADDAPVPGALIRMPRRTAADDAAHRTAIPERSTTAAGDGPTAPPGPLVGLGEPHQPIGRPVASEADAHAVVQRLVRGEADALRSLGIEPPAGFDPRTREWGIGITRGGDIVIYDTGIRHRQPALGLELDPARAARDAAADAQRYGRRCVAGRP